MMGPSFHSTSKPGQQVVRLAKGNASGATTEAPGIRYGRSASGTWRRNAPSDSGAAAYTSTLAEVIRPTRACQLGNGNRKTRPSTNDMIKQNQGTPFLLTIRKVCGK